VKGCYIFLLYFWLEAGQGSYRRSRGGCTEANTRSCTGGGCVLGAVHNTRPYV